MFDLPLEAYIDESISGDVFVLGGYISDAATWTKFSKDWEEMLPFSARDRKGNWQFKMSEMAQNRERMDRAHVFFKIIERYRLFGISISFKLEDHKNAMKRIWSLNKKVAFGESGNPYMLAMGLLFMGMQKNRDVIKNHLGDDSIDFIFDERQAEKKSIINGYVKLQPFLAKSHHPFLNSHPRFGSDKDFLPLQAADMHVWTVRRMHEQNTEIFSHNGLEFDASGSGDLNKMTCMLLEIDEDNITNFIIEYCKISDPLMQIYGRKFSFTP